jgi:hypothetical protein
MKTKQDRRSRARALVLAGWILLAAAVPTASAYHDDDRDRHERKGYVFATTRGLTEMDIHPAFKIPILPVAVLIDIIAFPIALLADTIGD